MVISGNTNDSNPTESNLGEKSVGLLDFSVNIYNIRYYFQANRYDEIKKYTNIAMQVLINLMYDSRVMKIESNFTNPIFKDDVLMDHIIKNCDNHEDLLKRSCEVLRSCSCNMFIQIFVKYYEPSDKSIIALIHEIFHYVFPCYEQTEKIVYLIEKDVKLKISPEEQELYWNCFRAAYYRKYKTIMNMFLDNFDSRGITNTIFLNNVLHISKDREISPELIRRLKTTTVIMIDVDAASNNCILI
jgi:hypothetical protein